MPEMFQLAKGTRVGCLLVRLIHAACRDPHFHAFRNKLEEEIPGLARFSSIRIPETISQCPGQCLTYHLQERKEEEIYSLT